MDEIINVFAPFNGRNLHGEKAVNFSHLRCSLNKINKL